MEKKIFIQSNNKQMLGALVAKYALEKHMKEGANIPVEILNVDEMDLFTAFDGVEYKRGDVTRVYEKTDLQSFTLSRFMPAEIMDFSGMAIVIDPDIFALQDVSPLFEKMEKSDSAILACEKNGAWDSSLMVLRCEKLTHWKIEDLLNSLREGVANYTDIISLKSESVEKLSRLWNNLDKLDGETKVLHTTGRLTQPWKQGLEIDFKRNKMPKLFGFISREWLHKLRGKYPTHYTAHPNKEIETFFFGLVREMYDQSVLTKEQIDHEIQEKNIRRDSFEVMMNVSS
jgi:hypothetical protein